MNGHLAVESCLVVCESYSPSEVILHSNAFLPEAAQGCVYYHCKRRQSVGDLVESYAKPNMVFKKEKLGWMKHVLTVVSVILFIFGCIIIGYMAWIMATSISVNKFMSGTLIFSYVVIGLGFVLFFTGLIGWVGSASESICLIRMFVAVAILAMLAEIGGIIALNVIQIQVDDILESGWTEVNQGTRNLVQVHLQCCGFDGPQEFAYSTLPIDDSCYDDPLAVEFEEMAGMEYTTTEVGPMRLKQAGCGEKLKGWFDENKICWVSGFACVGALEFLAAGVALFLLRKANHSRRPRTASRRLLKAHAASIATDNLPSELP